jgi:hypothetical protein
MVLGAKELSAFSAGTSEFQDRRIKNDEFGMFATFVASLILTNVGVIYLSIADSRSK